MRKQAFGKQLRDGAVVTATILALVGTQSAMAQPASGAGPYGPSVRDGNTTTPIKHVIIIIGENRTFDNVYATYVPKSGQTVWNLLSEGIVNPDGTPGPNYSKATQSNGSSYHTFQLAPPSTPFTVLPPFQVGGYSTPPGCELIGITTGTNCNTPANVTAVMPYENGLARDYYQYLLTGGTGQTSGVPDARVWYGRPGREQFAAWSVPDNPEDACAVHAVRRLHREPRASPVPDVARARLLRRQGDHGRPVGLPPRSKARLRCSFSTFRRATRLI